MLDGDDEDCDEEEEAEVALRRARKARQAPEQTQEQVITGLPNELLLPGAIVTLAVVIAGVFTISRLSNR